MVFVRLSRQKRPSRRSISRLGSSVNLQKKKILPGHRASGVSWRVFAGVPKPTAAVNDCV
jgi:hypothetical protein